MGLLVVDFNFFFVDLAYLQVDDDSSQNEVYNEGTIKRDNVIKIGGFLDNDDSGLFSYNDVNIDEVEGPFAPMEWALFWLQKPMAKITSQCKELTSVQLYDHATSCLQIVASKIQAFHVNHAWINAPWHGFKSDGRWLGQFS